MNTARKNHSLAFISLVMTVLFWGAGFVLTDTVLQNGCKPGFTNCVRFLTATATTGIIFCKKIKLDKRTLLYGLIGGAALFGGFTLQLTGLQYTTPANNGFFTAAYILFVPFLAWMFTKKRPDAIVFIGIAAAVAGLFILNFGDVTNPNPYKEHIWLGNMLTLVSALFFAVQMSFSDYAVKKTDAMSLTFAQLATAAVLFVLYFLCFEAGSTDFGAINWKACVLPLAFVALLGTGFAYPAQISAQRFISPSETSLILSAESFVGAVLSVAIGSDTFSWVIAVGGTLVVAAVLLVEFVPSYLAKKRIKQAQNAEEAAPDDQTD